MFKHVNGISVHRNLFSDFIDLKEYAIYIIIQRYSQVSALCMFISSVQTSPVFVFWNDGLMSENNT